MPKGCAALDEFYIPRPILSYIFACVSENRGPYDDMEQVYHREHEIKHIEHIGRQRDTVVKLVRVLEELDDTERKST